MLSKLGIPTPPGVAARKERLEGNISALQAKIDRNRIPLFGPVFSDAWSLAEKTLRSSHRRLAAMKHELSCIRFWWG